MRASWLIRIFLLLQTRGSATAEEFAHELEVPVHTIYRDWPTSVPPGYRCTVNVGTAAATGWVGGYRTSPTG